MRHETLPTSEDKPIEVDGWQGREMSDFRLHSLLPSQLGSDRFTEVYLETESGNTYAILEEGYINPDTQEPLYQFVLLNGRDLAEAAKKGQQGIPMKRLDRSVIEDGEVKVGEPFNYKKGNTSKLQKITCVNAGKYYAEEEIERVSHGVSSDVRSQFWALAHLKPPHGQEQ